jgi:FkbM family methyltransferase
MKIINYYGFDIYVPYRYYHSNLIERFEKNIYEKEEIGFVNKYFNKNDYVLELGSCLGIVSALLSKICNNVISVEANPELKESLELTKKNNNLDNVLFINGYLDKEKKEIEYQTYDNIVAGSGDREDKEINNVRGWGNTQKIYNIQTIILNEIENIENINSLVIDIEGGELKFLYNFDNFINSNIKKICIELHGHLMKENEDSFNCKCINMIIKNGFKLIERNGISYYFEK